MMYKAINGSKMAEQTSWESGCDPDTLREFDYNLEFTGETIQDLLLELTEHLGVDPSHVYIDDLNNLVNISRLENDQGIPASESEKTDWKDGHTDYLWNCNYQFEIVEQKQVDLSNLTLEVV